MLLRPLKSSATRCWRTRISSFANFTRETHEIAPLRRPGLGISTFDPSRISPDDHMDLSNRYRRNVKLLSFGQQKAIMKMPYSHISGVRLPQPYPPNTKGFLVFHSPYPDKAPELAQLVFRLVPTPDPSLVFSAPVYNRPNTHLPWSIPLFDIVNYKCYRFVGEQLLKDGLVTPSLLTRIRRIYEKYKPLKRTPVICSTGQPWLFDFSQGWQYIFVLGHGRFIHCSMSWHSRFEYTTSSSDSKRALTGKAVVTFETFKRRLFLRIVEIVEPIRGEVAGAEVLIDSYTPGSYIPFHLTSPFFNSKSHGIKPTVVYGEKDIYRDPSAPWFVDPYDVARRDVQNLKGLRLLMDKPLTKQEEMVFDLPAEERIRVLQEQNSVEEHDKAEEHDTVEEQPENKSLKETKLHTLEDLQAFEKMGYLSALLSSTRV